MQLVAPLEIRSLWIGPTDRPEFASAWAVVRRRTGGAECANVAAAAALDESAFFDLAIVAESFPGELDGLALERLRPKFPATPWVRIVGSWCDGELRTASPPAGMWRVPWHRAAAWLETELAELRDGRCPLFGMPVTQGEEDRILAIGDERRHIVTSQRLPMTVGVAADEPAAADSLCDQLESEFNKIVRLGSPNRCEEWLYVAVAAGVDTLVVDLARSDGAAATIENIRQALPDAKLWAIVGFPRPDDFAQLMDAGATMVSAKPVAPSDWMSAIGREPR